ncbi:MAG: hypothetical protein E6J14_15210 [Chloroflexi bacterium]|nr:MAG: hypothetical protein E6J14_15210 [Chloroflexota bacterium]
MNAVDHGRVILRVYQHARDLPATTATSYIGAAIKAGRSMDFANRIRRRGQDLTPVEVVEFARLAALDPSDLILWSLPVLKRAAVIDYRLQGADIEAVEEYVGAAAPFLEQVYAVWRHLGPRAEDECTLEAVALAASAPLLASDHEAALESMGFPDDVRQRALAAAASLGLLRRARSAHLDEEIIYNEYVWGENAQRIASFLAALPPDERDLLAHLSGQAMEHPGIPIRHIGAVQADILRGARKVGFLDAARVVTTTQRQESFAFSPALERELARKHASDALHERKLFVAHILFGHHFGFPGTGRVQSPLVLVNALLQRGTVGPASAITSDYPLLESFGIVRVRASSVYKGRSHLHLVKRDVVEDSLELLRAAARPDMGRAGDLAENDPLASLWTPGGFVDPERDRQSLSELRPEARELFDYSIARLRDEIGRVTRAEEF